MKESTLLPGALTTGGPQKPRLMKCWGRGQEQGQSLPPEREESYKATMPSVPQAMGLSHHPAASITVGWAGRWRAVKDSVETEPPRGTGAGIGSFKIGGEVPA